MPLPEQNGHPLWLIDGASVEERRDRLCRMIRAKAAWRGMVPQAGTTDQIVTDAHDEDFRRTMLRAHEDDTFQAGFVAGAMLTRAEINALFEEHGRSKKP